MGMSDVAVSIRNVTQRYGEANAPDSVLALDDISLDRSEEHTSELQSH